MQSNKGQMIRFIGFSVVFLLSMMAAYWRFHEYLPTIFFEDDLNSLQAFYEGRFSSTLYQALFDSTVEKYRPIFQLLCYFMFSQFGALIPAYIAFNLITQGINGLLFFVIARRLADKTWFIPFVLTMVFVTSRFALFQMHLVIAPVESIALTFFLLMLYSVYQAGQKPSTTWWSWAAILYVNFAMYTHERYIVVLPWLAMVLYFHLRDSMALTQHRLRAYFPIVVCIMSFAMNYFIKVYLLHIPFFVGTGGTHITLDSVAIMAHTQEIVQSVFGFNTGPMYLVGLNIPVNPCKAIHKTPSIMAIVFLLSWFYSIIIALVTKSNKAHIKFFILGLILIGLLMIPPIMTIRIEGRWEYAPFAILLLSLSWCYGLSKKNLMRVSLGFACILASVSTLVIDGYVASSFNNIYMMGWTKFAEAARRDLFTTLLNEHKHTLLLLTNDDGACAALQSKPFLSLYAGKTASTYCTKTPEGLSQLHVMHPNSLSFTYTPVQFERIYDAVF